MKRNEIPDSNDYFKALLEDILGRYGAEFQALRDLEGGTPADAYEAYQILTPLGDREGE
jgi:hypothetical protein